MRPLTCLLIILSAFGACKKKDSSVAQPTQPTTTTTTTTPTIKLPSDKMNGSWICIGKASAIGTPAPPDAFTRVSLAVVNDTTILVNGTTFNFDKFDSTNQTINFQHKDSNNPYSYQYFTYHTPSNTFMYNWSTKYWDGYLSSAAYKYDGALKDHIPNITGPKTLTGTVYDTFVMRSPMDTLYEVDTTINFNAIDDSTIVIDQDFLDIHEQTLHYKRTDSTAKTIVFQSFHTANYQLTTLTYNYETKSIVLEQKNSTVGRWASVKLQ